MLQHSTSSFKKAPLPLHPGCITHVLMIAHSRRHLVHVQVSNAHGWHGARNMARANEQQKQKQQQKQQQQQQQKQQQKQKQKLEMDQKQSKQQQQQNGGGRTRVSSLSPDPAGALSVDGVEARIPAICTHSHLWHSHLLLVSPAHAPFFCA